MNLQEVRARAKERLKPYCRLCPICDGRACAGEVPGMGGIGTGSSFINNVQALKEYKLNLRTLHNVSDPSTATTLFGHNISTPILGAPMAGTKPNLNGILTDYELTAAIIGGCRRAGTLGMAGHVDSSARQVLQAEDGQGLFIYKPVEQREIIKWGKWTQEIGAQGFGIDVDGAGLINMRLLGISVEPKTPEKIRQLTQTLDLPFILKGIMTPDEAELAVESGARAIVVSNHGGRVLDHTPGTAAVLPGIAERVRGKVTIMVDGGIRSGTDVLKMLALGADQVLIGRPLLQAALGGGAEGVKLALEQLTVELKIAMILTGTPGIKDVSPQILL